MQLLCSSMATLAVATIYYAWRAYAHLQAQQNKLLHERVAHMLWMVAEQPE
jgi:hypothetical protein